MPPPVPPPTDVPALAADDKPPSNELIRELREARVALAEARLSAAALRAQSARLRARAQDAARAADAARALIQSHGQLWEDWRRIWTAVRAEPAAPGTGWLVHVCAYCGAATVPGSLDRAANPGEGDGAGSAPAWSPLPPWVRDALADGTLGVHASHGACPTCAVSRLGG